MRKLILLVSVVIALQSFGQDNNLVNTWGMGSRYIYIGVTNELKQGYGRQILSASSREASISISADSTSLIVKPRLAGPVIIRMATEDADSLVVDYVATYLPYPRISLGDSAFDASSLTVEQARQATSIRLKGDGKGYSIFDQCFISCSEIQIGDQLYSCIGETLTDQIRDALTRINAGDKIIVKKMMLEVRSTGKQVKIDPARSFLVRD
jgi:hypothetical protein